jgi:hypothetical protein
LVGEGDVEIEPARAGPSRDTKAMNVTAMPCLEQLPTVSLAIR